MNNEKDLLYTKEHEWIKIDEQYAYVGISNHAQSELGDIIFVELPSVGETFKTEDVFGTIEAVKTVADLFMPISGEIVEINENIDSAPEVINSSPYNDGWLVKIKILNNSEIDNLLSYESYQSIIQ
tara:strand:+ start:540 stop:917 length:378 start_codon:yes stop_codon:yes gene_type:complete